MKFRFFWVIANWPCSQSVKWLMCLTLTLTWRMERRLPSIIIVNIITLSLLHHIVATTLSTFSLQFAIKTKHPIWRLPITMTQPAMLCTSSSYNSNQRPWWLAHGPLEKTMLWESRSQTPSRSQIGLQTVWKGTDVICTMTPPPPVCLPPSPLGRGDLLQNWAFHPIVPVVFQKTWSPLL